MCRPSIRRSVLPTLLALTLGDAFALPARASAIYYTFCVEGCGLNRVDLNGMNHQGIIAGGSAFGLDLLHGKLYFSGDFFSAPNTIRRCDLDGGDAETLLSGVHAGGLVVDAFGGKFYWADFLAGVRRANLDGSSVETLVAGEANDIDLDLLRGKVYWTDGFGLKRADLDGSNIESVIAEDDVHGIKVYAAGGKIYWADTSFDDNSIRRADLDGSNVETVLAPPQVSSPSRRPNCGQGSESTNCKRESHPALVPHRIFGHELSFSRLHLHGYAFVTLLQSARRPRAVALR